MGFGVPELSLALAGVEPGLWPGGVRAALAGARAAGFRSVALNGAMPGVRARDLDRSGRRDLAALLRRSELACSGIDLWIPKEHFADAARVDRALDAVLEAIELAADVARLAGSGVVNPGHTGAGGGRTVSVVLAADTPGAVIDAIAEGAERCSVRVADCEWPVRTGGVGSDGAAQDPTRSVGVPGPIGSGIDPAVVLAAGGDPAREVSLAAASKRLVSARLSDMGPGGRVVPGSRSGRLDLTAYAAAVVAGGYAEPVVLDLRGVMDQGNALVSANAAWQRAFGAVVE